MRTLQYHTSTSLKLPKLLSLLCKTDDVNTPDGTANDDPESGGGVPADVQEILDTFKDRFDLSDTSPANVPIVHVPLKPEYKKRNFIGLNQKGLYVTKRLLTSMAKDY